MKYYLSALTCIDTSWKRDVVEWFLWNKFIGVEHFYIFDDQSEIPVEEILADYKEDVTITKLEGSKNMRQSELQEIIYDNYKHQTEWMAFIDDDEYIFPNTDLRFPDFLKGLPEANCVELHWRYFSPQEMVFPLTEAMRIIDNYKIYHYTPRIKSIVNTKKVPVKDLTENNVHRMCKSNVFNCLGEKTNSYAEGPNGITRWGLHTAEKVIEDGLFHLNHYSIKSAAHLVSKFKRGFKQSDFNDSYGPNDSPVEQKRLMKILKIMMQYTSEDTYNNFKKLDFKKDRPELRNEYIEFEKRHGYNKINEGLE